MQLNYWTADVTKEITSEMTDLCCSVWAILLFICWQKTKAIFDLPVENTVGEEWLLTGVSMPAYVRRLRERIIVKVMRIFINNTFALFFTDKVCCWWLLYWYWWCLTKKKRKTGYRLYWDVAQFYLRASADLGVCAGPLLAWGCRGVAKPPLGVCLPTFAAWAGEATALL